MDTLHLLETLKISNLETDILLVELNRPEFRNAINSTMMKELLELWRQFLTSSQGIRCIILTGHGDKAFCAGADLKERLDLPTPIWKEQHVYLQTAMRSMIECPIPIIAAVNGAAFGGGLELALASDFIYAAKGIHFAQSEAKLGIMPGAMGTQNLPRACNLRRAKELCFTAQFFTAEEALEWGIINRLCQPEDLLKEALSTAKLIAANAPLAIKQIKKSLSVADHLSLQEGYSFEIAAYNQLIESKDRQEGIRAFNEKRQPHFHDN